MLQLEKYRTKATRYTCPECGKRNVFTRYVDESGNQIADELGRCDRESKCGYHLKPKEYFDSRGIVWTPTITTPKPQPEPMELTEIPASYFTDSLKNSSQNSFIKFLLSRYDRDDVLSVAERYTVGDFEGFTVFWRMDASGKVWTAKLIRYDAATGKRIKGGYSLDWMHSVLKKRDVLPENSDYRRGFFGAHLVTDDSTPIAIVEAEKTAIIAALVLPEYLWLACGGKTQISAEKLAQFNRRVILFPDGDGFQQWSEIAIGAQAKGANITVSDLLENELNEAQKVEGYDLADYLLMPEIEAETTHSAKPDVQTIDFSQPLDGVPSDQLCPKCEGQLLTDDPRHFWCVPCRFDSWLPNPSRQPESVNFCVDCGAYLNDSGACEACHQPIPIVASQSKTTTMTA